MGIYDSLAIVVITELRLNISSTIITIWWNHFEAAAHESWVKDLHKFSVAFGEIKDD